MFDSSACSVHNVMRTITLRDPISHESLSRVGTASAGHVSRVYVKKAAYSTAHSVGNYVLSLMHPTSHSWATLRYRSSASRSREQSAKFKPPNKPSYVSNVTKWMLISYASNVFPLGSDFAESAAGKNMIESLGLYVATSPDL